MLRREKPCGLRLHSLAPWYSCPTCRQRHGFIGRKLILADRSKRYQSFRAPVEHDLLAVWSDVEGAHGRGVMQPRKLATLFSDQVEQPKVLHRAPLLHIDESLAVGQ